MSPVIGPASSLHVATIAMTLMITKPPPQWILTMRMPLIHHQIKGVLMMILCEVAPHIPDQEQADFRDSTPNQKERSIAYHLMTIWWPTSCHLISSMVVNTEVCCNYQQRCFEFILGKFMAAQEWINSRNGRCFPIHSTTMSTMASVPFGIGA